jgi:hypothetical protein
MKFIENVNERIEFLSSLKRYATKDKCMQSIFSVVSGNRHIHNDVFLCLFILNFIHAICLSKHVEFKDSIRFLQRVYVDYLITSNHFDIVIFFEWIYT